MRYFWYVIEYLCTSYYNKHGTMSIYGVTMLISKTIFITISSTKFITTVFNKNMKEALYIIVIYKPPQM